MIYISIKKISLTKLLISMTIIFKSSSVWNYYWWSYQTNNTSNFK